jgi:hypothetical protein
VAEGGNGAVAKQSDRSLTEMQLVFINYLVEGLTQTEAARLAGYSHPSEQAWHLVRHPRIQDELQVRRQARIVSRTVGLALAAMDAALEDPKASHTAKFPYVKLALALGGHHERVNDAKGIQNKDLSEMTPDELAQTIAEARQARADIEARMRDVTPNDAQKDGPVIDAAAVEPS